MTRKTFIFSLFMMAVCMAFPLNGVAAHFSGAYMLHICASDDEGKEKVPGGHTACQAYIAGVLDYHTILKSLGTAPSVDFCIPDDVDLNVLQQQVYSFILKNRAQHRQFIASPAVSLAMHSYYPCR